MIIDCRERGLIEKLDNIKVEQLDIGDIIFKKDDEIILLVERKTVDDLKASIIDGRNREQKARILGSGTPNERILYIIEGNLDKSLENKSYGVPISVLLGSLINTQYRDNIKVYKTSSIQETSVYLKKILQKFNTDLDAYFNEDIYKINKNDYCETLNKKKKLNNTPSVWFINQLVLIPQVTVKIASVITEQYKTINILCNEYDRTPEHLKTKLLSDLLYPINNGKTRRIGDKVSARIYNYIYGIEE